MHSKHGYSYNKSIFCKNKPYSSIVQREVTTDANIIRTIQTMSRVGPLLGLARGHELRFYLNLSELTLAKPTGFGSKKGRRTTLCV